MIVLGQLRVTVADSTAGRVVVRCGNRVQILTSQRHPEGDLRGKAHLRRRQLMSADHVHPLRDKHCGEVHAPQTAADQRQHQRS